VLGGEERIEDVFEVTVRDALACIFRHNLNPVLSARFDEFPGPDAQRAALFVHCIQRVEKEVQEDLFDLLTV